VEAVELAPDRLKRRLDPARLPFDSTADVPPLEGTIGQPRAIEALQFGLAIPTGGFNIFVTGIPGSGRLATVEDHLERVALTRPAANDWVYVHNFSLPSRPVAISLASGRGRALATDMDQFVTAARREIARALESEDYQSLSNQIGADAVRRIEERRRGVEQAALSKGFAVRFGPAGVGIFPMADGKPLSPEEAAGLPADQREQIEQRAGELRKELDVELPKMRQIEREGAERAATLERETALAAITPLLYTLRDRYAAEAAVLDHLAAIEHDIPQHLADFRSEPSADEDASPDPRNQAARREEHLGRYRVNVLVDNGDMAHAPVVIERNPTYYNLFGRVEYRTTFGALVTDFTNIRAGSLHRANGGFLVIEADDVLRQPFAWEALKRTLRTGEVAIENLSEQASPVPTATLHPAPIRLDVKVILIGSTSLYQLLNAQDEDLRGLFKVRADFAPDMDWNDESVAAYAAFLSRTVVRSGLRHFSRDAVARIIEHGARLREDQRKLSARLAEIADIASEASFWAGSNGHELVGAADVEEAVRHKRYRSNLTEERLQELIRERTINIETDADAVGQVNGLTILGLGDYEFGLPARVTATISLGRGRVESVERESNLSGPIHSKGVLILSGYLAGKYAQDQPFPVRATITFEQSYNEVEGDSASSTELYAILSALSGLPIKQGIAVTGSVNQRGDVQAVGGVTEKVEGFFRVCQQRGLTGAQGVMIPASNVDSLMLADDVVSAVADGTFHVWTASSVDDGIELLTGRPAGTASNGEYPSGTVHQLISDRVRDYANRLRKYAQSGEETA
jgi:lon-related putative ATP-dependent protease